MEREMEEGVKRERKGDRKERQQGREGESIIEEREEEGRGGKDGEGRTGRVEENVKGRWRDGGENGGRESGK